MYGTELLTFVPQVTVLGILVGALILFLQNKIRYDIVAILVLLAIIATGLMPYRDVFANFGHPAIIIVASMFIMSEAFVRSGFVDAIIGRMTFLHTRPILALSCLVILVVLLSAFVNNAGALAMAIPIAIYLARKSNTSISLFLLPLAFASHLGGFLTLIGTPRNIIISDFRDTAIGIPYAMFDFLPVGGVIAIAGTLFLVSLSWRFIPLRKSTDAPIISREYTTEVTVNPRSPVAKMTIEKFERTTKYSLKILGIFRNNERLEPVNTLGLLPNDFLLLRGEIDNLTFYTERYRLSLTGIRAREEYVTNADDHVSVEVLIPTYAKIIGTSWNDIPLQKRFGTNFIGLFRRSESIDEELATEKFLPNDMILLNGRSESVAETIESLQLLPIATEEIHFGRTSTIIATLSVLGAAIAIATFNIIPLPLIFLTASILLITTKIISLRQAYESIDPTVLILLAGMITLGEAIQISGAAETVVALLSLLDGFVGPIVMLGMILIITMAMSDFMNTTAAAVIMAPIAILVATNLGVSIDPFLMAVAIGASSAFLTPIGHESNTIVMKQGGYTFSDYFRVGLPLEAIIIAIALPMILYIWPL